MSVSRNGRPEAEVIANYADGFSYSKGLMEDAFRAGGLLEKVPTRPPKETNPLAKKADVDLIVHELEIPRAQAEKALIENGGDITKALRALVMIPAPSN